MIKFPHWFSDLLNEGYHEIGLWGEWIHIRSFPSGSVVKNLPAMPVSACVRFLGQEDPLEEGMAIHFSILA